MNKRLLLIVGAGDPSFRGYIVDTLAVAFDLVLIAESSPGWGTQYHDMIIESFDDLQSVAERIRQRVTITENSGIITYVESLVEVTANLASLLGLRSSSPEAATSARNKFLMRERLRLAGLRVPRYAEIRPNEPVPPLDLTLPCVVKPVSGHSSIQVRKISTWSQLADWLGTEKVPSEGQPTWLVEEYLSGSEFSVESLVTPTQILHLGVTEKIKGPEPFFEEIGQTFPARLGAEALSEMMSVASAGIAALGLSCCAVHTEMIVDENGPVIVEVGARLAGDKIPLLVKMATAVDFARLAGEAAFGRLPPTRVSPSLFASIAFFVPRRKGQLSRVPLGAPDVVGLREFEFWGRSGDLVAPPPDAYLTRLGYVVCTGKTWGETRSSIDSVLEWLSSECAMEFEKW